MTAHRTPCSSDIFIRSELDVFVLGHYCDQLSELSSQRNDDVISNGFRPSEVIHEAKVPNKSTLRHIFREQWRIDREDDILENIACLPSIASNDLIIRSYLKPIFPRSQVLQTNAVDNDELSRIVKIRQSISENQESFREIIRRRKNILMSLTGIVQNRRKKFTECMGEQYVLSGGLVTRLPDIILHHNSRVIQHAWLRKRERIRKKIKKVDEDSERWKEYAENETQTLNSKIEKMKRELRVTRASRGIDTKKKIERIHAALSRTKLYRRTVRTSTRKHLQCNEDKINNIKTN
eukprot:498887_1